MLTSYQLENSQLNMAQIAEANRVYGHEAVSVARGKFLGNTDTTVIIDNGEIIEKPEKKRKSRRKKHED